MISLVQSSCVPVAAAEGENRIRLLDPAGSRTS